MKCILNEANMRRCIALAMARVIVTNLREMLLSVTISVPQSPSSCFLVRSVCQNGYAHVGGWVRLLCVILLSQISKGGCQ